MLDPRFVRAPPQMRPLKSGKRDKEKAVKVRLLLLSPAVGPEESAVGRKMLIGRLLFGQAPGDAPGGH
jgi:hypothetical protein